jgi:hypothetical protein
MTEIIIHIGMPKTGTTAIQNTLATNKDLLKDKGLLFPKTGRFPNSNAHHAFFYDLTPNKKSILTPMPKNYKACNLYEELAQEIRESNPKYVILSSEMIWKPSTFDKECLIRIRQLFSDYKVKILVSLRSIDKHILSAFAQRVSGPQKYTGTIYDHIIQLNNEGMWDYKNRLDQLANAFGHESIYAYWYDDVKENALIPICSMLNISVPYKISNRVNARHSWLFLSIMRRVNLFRNNKSFISNAGYLLASRIESFGRRALPENSYENLFFPLKNAEVNEFKSKSISEKNKISESYDLFWWKT